MKSKLNKLWYLFVFLAVVLVYYAPEILGFSYGFTTGIIGRIQGKTHRDIVVEYLQKAGSYIDTQPRKTIELTDKALSLDSNPSPELWEIAFYYRGLANYRLGNYYGAIGDMNKVLGINPNSERAYYLRGLANRGVGNPYMAVTDLRKAQNYNQKEKEAGQKEFRKFLDNATKKYSK